MTTLKKGTTTYASAIGWHPNGKLSTLTRGNGNVYSQTLNPRQLPEHIGSYGELIHHTYFADGKLSGINAVNSARDRIFTYDGAGRLDAAAGPWGTSGNVWGYYAYDPLGNLTQKQLGTRVVDIEYTSVNRVNRVKDSAVSANWRVYSHDLRGNVTSDGIHGFVYDFANQPISISGADTGTFSYDGNLKRVKQVMSGQTIYSVYDRSGALLTRDNATTATKTDYLTIAGQTFVRLKNNVASYPFNDHLGTAMLVGEQNGSIPAGQVFNYTPFGESVGANDPGDANEQGYTGHVEDVTGLTYMQARYFDPVMGRFLATDPVGYLDQLNLYAYVANDPVNNIDPDGQIVVAVLPVVVGVGRAATLAYRAYQARHIVAVGISAGAMISSSSEENKGSDGGKVADQPVAPELPDGLVGEDSRPGRGRINSGPLAGEHGGTGDPQGDFDVLTGGRSGPAPEGSTLPDGTQVGENGIQIRPGTDTTGPRIDIPASGDKPRETLHYPSPPPPPRPDERR